MSKAARKRAHDEKMKQKRAKKMTKKAAYAALAGTSKKKKNQERRKTYILGTYKHAHIMSDCGNAGCLKCNPREKPRRLA